MNSKIVAFLALAAGAIFALSSFKSKDSETKQPPFPNPDAEAHPNAVYNYERGMWMDENSGAYYDNAAKKWIYNRVASQNPDPVNHPAAVYNTHYLRWQDTGSYYSVIQKKWLALNVVDYGYNKPPPELEKPTQKPEVSASDIVDTVITTTKTNYTAPEKPWQKPNQNTSNIP